jgi:hypothetical protein
VRRAAIAVLALAALALRPGAARGAEESAGTRAASFLVPPVAPSVLALGGGGLALGRDVQGATLDPAALGWLGSAQLAFVHADFGDQASQEWFGAATRVGGSRTRIGFTALLRDEGTLDGRDASGAPTGEVTARDMAFAVQLARPLGERLTVGGAGRVVHQQVGSSSGDGYAFDAGAQLRLGVVSLAVAGRDFGGDMRWGVTRWRMPASLNTGLAYEHAASGLRAAVDWCAPSDGYRSLRAGAEWRLHDRLALRGGYRAELGAPADDRSSGPSFGLGAGAGPWWIDYAYALGGDGVATQRVGLNLRGAPAANAASTR